MLVGCDRFVSMPSTVPAGANNVTKMYGLFAPDAEEVTVLANQIADSAALEDEITAAFDGADADDESWLYLSTHGVLKNGTEFSLVLSDGTGEDTLSVSRLKEMLDKVPGTKVIILDACHSGALIGKGMSNPAGNVFSGDKYKIITSCGGSELSWLWSSASDRDEGAGRFTAQLIRGMSAEGDRAADENRDGSITLSELKRYLRREHGASTVQTYPEESDLVLLTYDTAEDTGDERSIGSVVFDSPSRDGALLTVRSSFVVYHRLQLTWRLIPLRGGMWDFDSAGAYTSAENEGIWGPGYRTRLITASGENRDGYTLLTLMSTDDRGKPVPVTSRVIAHIPEDTDPMIAVTAGEDFNPEQGEEMRVRVRHSCPCTLTVSVVDGDGRAVRYLCVSEQTRPNGADNTESEFWWNGRGKDGSIAAEGTYRVRVRATAGDSVYEAYSGVFRLTGGRE
ncbi:MAG: caspase family protein [Clostridia bacterium]|nr:caspase family protein [Clostridia bacterium]